MSESATMLGDEPLTEVEREVLGIYQSLKDLLKRGDLPPCVSFSAKQALAAIFPAVNDLGLEYEFLFDYGV